MRSLSPRSAGRPRHLRSWSGCTNEGRTRLLAPSCSRTKMQKTRYRKDSCTPIVPSTGSCKKVRDADSLADTIASPFRDPGESDELRRRLRQALTTLGERQRAVIVLHDIEGFKHSEIGRMLGIPEGTARSDLHHARARLRQELGPVRSFL